MDIQCKRVYESIGPNDGLRVLVDRLWPRGLTKEQVQADVWAKDLAPSIALRKWFGHDRSKMEEFRCRYFMELDAYPEALTKLPKLLEEAGKTRVTLLYAAKDHDINQAVVLRDFLLARRGAC